MAALPYTKVTLQAKGSLDPAIELPFQFRYEEPNPQKRFNITQGCGSSIIQESKIARVMAGTIIPFTMIGTSEDYKLFKELYSEEDPTTGGSVVYFWTGYWREVYEVKFYSLDNGKPTGRLFTFGGSFIILCVVDEPDFENPYQDVSC